MERYLRGPGGTFFSIINASSLKEYYYFILCITIHLGFCQRKKQKQKQNKPKKKSKKIHGR